MFALIDANNFFASCERVFNPKLEGYPVVVLSNNDGCIIARSNEAKKLGIPMGAPIYKYRELCSQHKVKILSSNFELYGNMSNRIMHALSGFVPELEIYSIDEAFVDFSHLPQADLNGYATNIRRTIKQWTGIPVSIGIASTKTLAKIANLVAKKQTESGVFNLVDKSMQDEVLANFPIEDIWGVGYNLAQKLRILGINTAKDLRDHDMKKLRKYFTVTCERIVMELRGTSCLELESITPPRKNITTSRSFGNLITDIIHIKEAVSYYTAKACIKMRKQAGQAQALYVYLKTNKFRSNEPQYKNGMTHGFAIPTHDTRIIINAATKLVDKLFKPGFKYHKAGVMLLDILPNSHTQHDLFAAEEQENSKKLMFALDELNADIGKDMVVFATQGVKRPWQMRSNLRSSRYTTNWDELLQVG